MEGFEFTVSTDVYEEVYDDDGKAKLKLVKENVKTKWFCRDLDDITDIEQLSNDNGNIRIQYTRVITKSGDKIVNMNYTKMKNLLNRTRTIGFKK